MYFSQKLFRGIAPSWMRVRVLITMLFALNQTEAIAIDVDATVKALRLTNTITGGFLTPSDPIFAQMVTRIQNNDLFGAALLAANSPYFANYLARRMAFQMQTPVLDSEIANDNDATWFLIAHFVGANGPSSTSPRVNPSISTIWSDNSMYLVNANGVLKHANQLTEAEFLAVDWNQLVQVVGQEAKRIDDNNVTITISPAHVGGYTTLSNDDSDQSYARYGAEGGTNLRFIEGIWRIATGLQLMDVASANALASDVPRFVPENDSNFFHGNGQPACISCHGGGYTSLNHGYSAVADRFDFGDGLKFNPAPTPHSQNTGDKKSLGSDSGTRNQTFNCNLVTQPASVCNPDSRIIYQNEGWDLRDWEDRVLPRMGWTGATVGYGLNSLGTALGRAKIVYEYMTKRVVRDVCPMGMFTEHDVESIATAVNPYAQPAGTDDIRTIVAYVASHWSCL